MQFYTIYKTTNKLSGKFYHGQHITKNLDDGYLGSGKLLKYAIKKYGMENFQKEILFIFETEAEMNAKEKEVVTIGPNSYNLCEGGKGGFGHINKTRTTEDYRRIGILGAKNSTAGIQARDKKIGIFDPKYKEIRRSWGCTFGFLGRTHTEETKKRIGDTQKGNQIGSKNSQFGTCWITKDSVNRKCKKSELEIFQQMGWSKGRV